MGITGLWDEVGSGELVSLAQLATNCLKQKGRPFRIAVDEAGWRFNNLTPQQVAVIKAKEPAARPIEKAIFHRIVSLLQLNIQLLFVFDGPKRPWKRGRRGGGKVEWKLIKETRDLLHHLSVPHHIAPGEAEAECARLQQEGIVDAVWTDDGDALMFGTTTLIKTHHEKGGAKSKTHVKVFRAEEIKQKYGLDQDGFVLFALLAGGDYDTAGLPGCGPKTALKLAKEGLGQPLRGVSLPEMHIWRQQLKFALRGKCEVPLSFPNMKALKYYTNPTVSTQEQLRNLRGLQKGWDKPLKENELRSFIRTHYNIQTKGYLKHIVPILLLRALCATTPGLERTNNIYAIGLARTRKKKDAEEGPALLERKITYLPQPVTSLDLSSPPGGPEGEDWTQFTGKNGEPFDAKARIDCEMLEYALQRGVPQVLQKMADEASKPTQPKKRKSASGLDREGTSSQKRPRKQKSQSEDIEADRDAQKSSATSRVGNDGRAVEESTQKPLENSSGNSMLRPTFRLPPEFIVLEDIEQQSGKRYDLGAASSLHETKESLFVSTIDAVTKRTSTALLYDDSFERRSSFGAQSSAPSKSIATPSEQHDQLVAPEDSSALLRAKRLAHFGNSTGSSPSASGRSVADAIVLD